MTTSRSPRGEPGRPSADARHEPRIRPSEERILSANRTSRRIAIAALVVAAVAIGLAAWRFVAPADTGCQSAAWDASPAKADLPANWTISSTQYDVNSMQMTLLGPAPQDDTTTQAVVYATVTCYPQDAAESVKRSAAAATAAGQTVTSRDDLGDQAFVAVDTSNATFLQFRRGSVVVYLAASGDATTDEVEGVASAFDIGMGGDGIAAPIGTPDAGVPTPTPVSPSSSAAVSPEASASAAAPELESALPSKVGDVDLTIESAVGTDILGTDQGSRAIAAALRAEGRSTDDLRVAQAYDATGGADLSILAIRVEGMKLDALLALVKDSWLAASGAGVKEDQVTLGGRTFTRIDYGDQGTKNYILAEDNKVIVIETADADLAAQAAAALP